MNKLTDHLRRHWMTYLLIIAVIILLYMLLAPGKPVESHRTEADNLNKEYKDLRDSLSEGKKRDIIQQKVIISQDSAIRSIRANNEVTRRELDKTKVVAQRLAKEIKQIQPEDTSEYAHKVDDLIAENQNLIWLNDQYVTAVDSLNKVVDEQKAVYEKRINDKVTLINDMSKGLDNSHTAYNNLNKDNLKLGKRLATSNVVSKSLVVVVLVETAIIVFKK